MPLVLFLCALPANATESVAPAQKQVDQQKEQVHSQKQTRQSPAKKKHPAATTFTPSEKIGADTVIAFPVDI
ncbi:MAG TPA: hypothetical protein ENK89_04740 [Desulfobulbaceae bacterium]|nr:hypothetical protein [Desulfobulbaceae bacterium]